MVNTETLKDNPDLGKALVGIWYETMALMADTGDKGKAAREAMAKLSGTDLAGFEAQLKTTRMFYTPKEAVAFATGADLPKTMDLVRTFSLRAQPARRRRQDARTRSASPSRRRQTLGDEGNVKLRFDADLHADGGRRQALSRHGRRQRRERRVMRRVDEHRAGPRRPAAAGAAAVRC